MKMGKKISSLLPLWFFFVGLSFHGYGQEADLGEPPRWDGAVWEVERPDSDTKGLAVDTTDRASVVDFFFSVYMASEGVASDWTGDVAGCIAGATSAAYEAATLLRINYYRAMAGLFSGVTLDPAWNAQCQEAALMMIANTMLSHTPPMSWTCWTASGSGAAGNSNLAIGGAGPMAVDFYIEDFGLGNEPVGHRRWLLFPPQRTMGTGSVTAVNNNFFGANAIWVLGGAAGGSTQSVAWPPQGFVPFQVAYDRWSYSSPGANFGSATVSMTQNGNPASLNVLLMQNGFGDNTIVWEPQITKGFAGGSDQTFVVTIRNVLINFLPQTIVYTVVVIDPSVAGGEGSGGFPGGTQTKVSGCGVAGDDNTGTGAGEFFVFVIAVMALIVRRRPINQVGR